jgi:hypothetical protein
VFSVASFGESDDDISILVLVMVRVEIFLGFRGVGSILLLLFLICEEILRLKVNADVD